MQCTVLLTIQGGRGATETVGETKTLFYSPLSVSNQRKPSLSFKEYLKEEDFSDPPVKRKQELYSTILFILMIQSSSSRTLDFYDPRLEAS